jgi:hypothetical protein
VSQEIGGLIFFGAIAAAVAYGWASGKSRQINEDQANRNLRKELEEKKKQIELKAAEDQRTLRIRETYVEGLRQEFLAGYLRGRKWLANFIAEAEKANDEIIEFYLLDKKNPAEVQRKSRKRAQSVVRGKKGLNFSSTNLPATRNIFLSWKNTKKLSLMRQYLFHRMAQILKPLKMQTPFSSMYLKQNTRNYRLPIETSWP